MSLISLAKSLLLLLSLLASVSFAQANSNQLLLQPWPTDLYIFSGESAVLRVDEYIQGNSITLGVSQEISGVSTVSRLNEESRSASPAWSSSGVKVVRQLTNEAGSWLQQAVSLLGNNTVLIDLGNGTSSFDLNPQQDTNFTCFDLVVSPSLTVYVDCLSTTTDPMYYPYTYLLYTLAFEDAELQLVNTEPWWSEYGPSEELPLILTQDFLFLYTKNLEANSFINVYLLSQPTAPQLYAILDESFFPSEEVSSSSSSSDSSSFVLRDIKTISFQDSSTAFVNLKTGIYSFDARAVLSGEPQRVQTPARAAADPISLFVRENRVLLGFVSKSLSIEEHVQHEDSAEYELSLNVIDVETGSSLLKASVPGEASEIALIEASSQFIWVGIGENAQAVKGFSVYSTKEPKAIIAQWLEPNLESDYSSLFVDYELQKVLLFRANQELTTWKVLQGNQVIFQDLDPSSSGEQELSVIVETRYGSNSTAILYSSTLHVLASDEEGPASAPSQLIPGNQLLTASGGDFSYQVPLESFFGNFFRFSSNATDFQMTDMVILDTKLPVDILLPAPAGFSGSSLVGVSENAGTLEVYLCGFEMTQEVNCSSDPILEVQADSASSAIVLGEYFVVVFNSGGSVSYDFYDLNSAEQVFSLSSGVSDCVSYTLFALPMIACVNTSANSVNFYYNSSEGVLSGKNPKPLYTVSSGTFQPSLEFSPVSIVPGTADGVLITEDSKRGFLIVSLDSLAALGIATLLYQEQSSLGDCLVADSVLYKANQTSIEILDFNDQSNPLFIGSYELKGTHIKGTNFFAGTNFIYISTSAGINKFKKSAFSSMNSGVSVLSNAKNAEFSVLVLEGDEYVVIEGSETLIKSNDFFTLEFSLDSESLFNGSQYFSVNSTARGSSEEFQYSFEVSGYNNTVVLNTTDIDGNKLKLEANSTRFNLSDVFEGSSLFFDFAPSNDSDKGTLINVTNTLNNISLVLNGTFDPSQNTISSFSTFGSLVVGVAPQRLFFWQPDTLLGNGEFEFIFDLVMLGVPEYECTGASEINEYLLMVQCQTDSSTILALVSFLTGKPWLLEQIDSGKRLQSVFVTETNVYGLQINDLSTKFYERETLESYKITLESPGDSLQYIGSVNAHTLGEASLSIQDVDVLQVNGDDVILVTEDQVGVRVIKGGVNSLPQQVAILDLFNSSSSDFIFTGYMPGSVPVDLVCDQNDSVAFTCLMTFQTGNNYVFSIDFSELAVPRLALQRVLGAYGTQTPARGQAQFNSEQAIIVLQNRTERTMIAYDVAQKTPSNSSFSTGNSTNSTQLVGGDVIGANGVVFSVSLSNGTNITYVANSHGLSTYSSSASAFLEFGNSSEISSSYITVFAFNDNGVSNYTFNITSNKSNSEGSKAWVLVVVLVVVIVVIVIVGIFLERVFATRKTGQTSRGSEEPLKPGKRNDEPDDRTTENVFRVDISEEDSHGKHQQFSLQKRMKQNDSESNSNSQRESV